MEGVVMHVVVVEIGERLLRLGEYILLGVVVIYLVRQWWEFATVRRGGRG